jgi:L-alanine-DL-glutamate epimerase-like enolase superfamily enzyme
MAVTIASAQAIPLSIPFDHWAPPPMLAGRPRTHMEAVYIRVTASNGVVGWGEAFWGGWSATVAAFEGWIAPLALGKDVHDTELAPNLERTLHNLGRAGQMVFAISGLDIALWDIRGKLAGMPVHALLGGAKRKRLTVYASLLAYGGAVEHVRRNTARALERGYRQIKLHERTAETVAATRAVTGPDVPIMVDTNCAWLPGAATEAVLAMKPSSPLWVEEPIWPPDDFAALAALRQATGVPMAAGENACGVTEFRDMVASGAVDYAQPSVIKIGGLTNFARIIQRTEADGVTCVPHSPYFGPGYLATVHALAAKERESALERFFCDLAMTPYATSVPIVDGVVNVPDTPGLGADPEPELIERFRITR